MYSVARPAMGKPVIVRVTTPSKYQELKQFQNERLANIWMAEQRKLQADTSQKDAYKIIRGK